ncbi:hypothetical protein FJR48_10875 [Sulfurimonas lithotrophica]|uniref:Outer membrane lipoprotein carrier protein LolA n=1 Tax=Sulfurimonas lithotrophica TaxID=2590022 RepID=A0A5P8P3E9_9BACT|nr:hypothetical protein [Sulfurimonas lithotrophica]QFR50205.1 hypothetical protein FJR48_10875 [Sulfurimonas lithotrophica]
MRNTLLLILLTLTLDAKSYKFDEFRYVKAVQVEFKKSGTISINNKSISITYDKPQYQKVTSSKEGVTIDKGNGEIQNLEGRALQYTKVYLELIRELDDINNYKDNKNFSVEQDKNLYTLYPKEGIDFRIEKINIQTNNNKVKSFKMHMKNEDVITIVKK